MDRRLTMTGGGLGLSLAGVLLLHACGSDGGVGPGPGTTPEPEVPATITVSPSSFALLRDSTVQLVATVKDATGAELTTPVTWSSTASSVATVSESGLVTGHSAGSTEVRAVAGGVTRGVAGEVVESLNLQFPLDGVLGQDFYLLNYVDRGGVGQISDYACGQKSYDGHRGVDITLRSFAQMDSVVAIIVPTPGRVTLAQDGFFDRNKSWENGGGFANHVVLEHSNGMSSYYGHMMKGSVKVEVGENVVVGDTLGYVGSSGKSDVPHLHFEVREPGGVVDTYAGPCATTISHWADQDPYQDQFALIDGDLTLDLMDFDRVKDRASVPDTIPMNASGRFTVWVEYVNARAGRQNDFRVLRPDGSLVRQAVFTTPQFYSLSWWWSWWTLDGWLDTPGTWSVEIRHGGDLLAIRNFEVVPGSGGLAPAPGEGPRSGQGGGGLNSPHGPARY